MTFTVASLIFSVSANFLIFVLFQEVVRGVERGHLSLMSLTMAMVVTVFSLADESISSRVARLGRSAL